MLCIFFFFKQKTAYEMRISDWSSDVCSSDLHATSPRKIAFGGSAWTADRLGEPGACRPDADFLSRGKRLCNGGAIASRPEWPQCRAAIGRRRVGKECVSTCRYRW